MKEQSIFLQAFERLINQRLQRFMHESVDVGNIYNVIHETTEDIFSKCDFTLTDDSRRFVAERMFAGLTINGHEEMFKDHEHAKRTDIRRLPESDLWLLASLFGLAIMEEEITKEMKRRGMV